MNLKKITPYLVSIIGFAIISLIYFSPVLQGKKILQSDIVQFTGMSKEIQDFRAENKTEPYWTDAAFGGMPAYQVSTYFPYDFVRKIDQFFRFLPHPANYLFLYFLSFFVLLSILKVDWKLAFFGSLAFGFSTYLIIILGVGHNAKAHAVGYFPLVIAGVLLVFQRKYLWGFVLTALASALEIVAGHVQMTYYLLFVLFFIGIYQLWETIQSKEYLVFVKEVGILLVAAVLATGMNANHLLPTQEYAKESTRSASELTINPDKSPKEITTGLDKDYITEYSYGIAETFNLFIPRFTGGGNAENLGKNSETYRLLKEKISISDAKDFAKNAPGYFGNQPIVAAPAYIGAVLIFLFVLGIFIVPNRYKFWLLASIIVSLLLSWGKNLNVLTDFFIDYFPMYSKFRAVSSIQVIMELAIPLMAILATQQFLFAKNLTVEKKEKALTYAVAIAGGLALIFMLIGRSLFSFESSLDADYDQMIPGFADALMQDRKTMFFNDSLRSLLLVLLSAGALWLVLKDKVKSLYAILFIGFLMIYDGFGVAKRYVNDDDFVRASKVKEPFEKSQADEDILKDKSHYRVANLTVNPLNDGSTSYFHNSIGGYHAAKPRRYQELFEYQLANGNYAVLDLLNAKYLIVADKTGQTQVQANDSVFGNAWFANDITWAKNANEEMIAMDSISKTKAVINEQYKKLIPQQLIPTDSTATIKLESYQPNALVYRSDAKQAGVALFSEMYYPKGWTATIDGKPTEIFRANYILRALVLPAGKHEIVFKFDPEVIKKGGNISLISFLLFIKLVLLGIGYYFYTNKRIKQ